jgi:parallel beta-helix repeat protein
MFFISSVSATEYLVGVKVGDWVKYGDFVGIGQGTELMNQTDWMKVEVVEVSGKDVTLHASGKYKNGSDTQESGMIVNVETGIINGSSSSMGIGFLISANLQQGDALVMGSPYNINKTETRTYLGVSRSVNILELIMSESGFYYECLLIWDRASGMLLEIKMEITASITMKMSFDVIDTNIFASGPEPAPIYIRANGTVEGTDKIQRNGDIYTFTDNIYSWIVVERDNIIVDGAGYTLQGAGAFDSRGIELIGRSNVTIRNMRIKAFYYGVYLYSTSYSTVSGNDITNNMNGIFLVSSPSCTVSGNNVTNNDYYGVYLYSSFNNIISENNITANAWFGVVLDSSSSCTVSRNLLTNDGLDIWGSFGNVVVDNLVNGKPLVYLENVSGYAVSDAGQVVLVNCDSIVVNNLNLSNADVGVELWQTNNTRITNNNMANNYYGVYICSSSNNAVSGNNITTSAWFGIVLFSSSNSTVSGNSLANNNYGVYLSSSSSNRFFHNNFNDNAQQVFSQASTNVWDNGFCEGNYWSDYTSVDSNCDGIGDTPYVIDGNNQDNYPLMHCYIEGDYSHDGIVNIKDAAPIGVAWNKTEGTPGYNPHADLNMDGVINMADADIIRKNWQKHA